MIPRPERYAQCPIKPPAHAPARARRRPPDGESGGLRKTTVKGYVRRYVTVREGYTLVTSSTSSSGSRPGVFRSNFVIANRKTT